MNDDPEVAKREREDYLALLTHPGWLRLVAYTKSQFGVKAYAQRLEDVKDMSELMALKMAQRWLNEIVNWPQFRSEQLTLKLERDDAAIRDFYGSRRDRRAYDLAYQPIRRRFEWGETVDVRLPERYRVS